ncbi:hypothetical protein GF337_13405 [candidate division KSB1 bacterium]|nr:hypothetical protein [candidate division KSB1 bacterium]
MVNDNDIAGKKRQRYSIVEMHQFVSEAIELIQKGSSETGQNGLPKKEHEQIIQKLELVRESFKDLVYFSRPGMFITECPYQNRAMYARYHGCVRQPNRI